MAPQVTTSVRAYELARLLCDERAERLRKERERNVRREKVQTVSLEKEELRTVTEIDYKKHEQTVKELERQEKEERFEKEKQEAAQRPPVGGCSHDHQKEWQIYEKSTEEKIQAAERFRQEGNEAYRKHNYGLAAVHYRKALLQFDYTFPEGEEEEKACEKVKVPCLLNLAACKCQQEDWDEVLTHCRLALEIDPRLVKAFYRQGLAYIARDQFDLAKEALMSAHEIEPKNAEVLAALQKLKDTKEKYRVRRKEVAKEMISGASSKDDGVLEAQASREPPAAADSAPPPAEQPPKAAEEVAGEKLGTAAPSLPPPEPQSESGLRRRRPDAAAAAPQCNPAAVDQDDEDDEEISATQSKMLNSILLLAALLGAVAVVVLAVSFVSPDDR